MDPASQPTPSHFSDVLARHLETKEMTPGRLSKLTGIPRATITNWVKGRVQQPQQWQDLLQLALALELDTRQANKLLAAAAYPSLAALRESVADAAHLSPLDNWTGRQEQGHPERSLPPADHLLRHLPPPEHHRLVGIEPLVAELAETLAPASVHHFLSIEGMGGIGKTTLARALLARLAQSGAYDDIFWISARQVAFGDQGQIELADAPARSLADVVSHLAEQLGQQHLAGLAVEEKLARLRPILKTGAYLVVVDNLESVGDSQALLPALYPLAAPSRFLFTSRHTLSHFPYVFTRAVPQLSPADSRTLLEHELQRRGRLHTLRPAVLETIYAVIGGLPLALKLVAAQLSYHPLDDVMAGLRQADRSLPEQLYSYLYAHTWAALDHPAKTLLLSMLDISPEGEDDHWLRFMSGLEAEQFDAALRQLLDYSLLEVAGTVEEPVYRLHRMTITFLHTRVLQEWHEGDQER